MAYGEFKDLTRRTGCEKILRGKAFNITKNQKYDGYQGEHVPMVYKFFDRKAFGSGIKNENISKNELSNKLQKLLIRKLNQRKVHSTFYRQYLGS